MIQELKLTNFKRHRDLTINFTEGLQVLRARNEGGKSSVIHGISYALFGSKGLPDSVDETVTWGEDVKSMKVELTINFGSETFKFTRAKSGAEVLKDGDVFVTGQNEVSAFAAQMLGADAGTAGSLMVAGQNEIRGILDGGPKALATFIESMSGMEVFDQILDAAQNKLALGSPALLEERLKGAESTLAAATETLPVRPDATANLQQVMALNEKITAAQAQVPELIEAQDKARNAFTIASSSFLKRTELERDVERAKDQLRQAEATVVGHTVNASKPIPDVAPIKAQLQEALDWQARRNAYEIFNTLPYGPQYAASADVVAEEFAKLLASVKANEAELSRVEREIAVVSARRLNHTNCQVCGQDVTHLASVIETNAKVDTELAALVPLRLSLIDTLNHQEDIDADFQGYLRLNALMVPKLKQLHGFVALDESMFPPLVAWVGSVPQDAGPDVAALKTQLANAEAEVKAVEQAKTKLELVTSQLDAAQAKVGKLVDELEGFKGATSSEVLTLEQASKDATAALQVAEGTVILARNEIAELKRSFDEATKLWDMGASRVEDAEKVISETKKDLASLAGNNALVKKLRAIRPVIANQIWGTVLGSVSVMFSQIRGETSIVTKEAGGFHVNGHPIGGLSGSTKDALGVAIRCSLIRTFLPGCQILILDEPCAFMDTSRAESLLGFTSGLDMKQSILITHESISESIADSIHQL